MIDTLFHQFSLLQQACQFYGSSDPHLVKVYV